MEKVVIFLAIAVTVSSGLQCFTCEYEDSNIQCKGSNAVKSCSSTQDRCLTQTIWSSTREKLRIDKECASQSGCQEATEQLSKSYWCDKGKDAWGCVECCNTDLCNESIASTLHHIPTISLVMTVLTTAVLL
ncbi:uncharacterized protein LOC144453768 [Glandiceps talaboti]